MINQAADNSNKATEFAEKALAWVATSTGQNEIRNAMADAKRAQKQLEDARRVDPDSLNVPVTL